MSLIVICGAIGILTSRQIQTLPKIPVARMRRFDDNKRQWNSEWCRLRVFVVIK